MHSPGEEEKQNHSGVRDSLKADLLNASATSDGVVSLWSTFVPPGASPADTLKDMHAPAFTMPDIEPKTIAYPGDNPESADYTIVGKLGEGGMGIVFDAVQKHLRQRVALKMIKADRLNDPLARNSFFYEAVVTAGLEHPGIIPVLEFGITQDGRVFYVMRKATGVPWHRVIREKTRAENLEIFSRVADVMGYAHKQGVIHRDLKPANILLGEFGEVWVGDWGVALHRNTGGDYTHAHPGGTPQYMPPEMARCDSTRIGPHSDVYLLGAILFEIVTGTPPHTGDEPFATLGNAAGNILTPTSRVDSLLRVAYRAMAADPEQRYGDVAALQKAVRDCLAEDESAALVRRADAQLAAALKTGGYDAFQQALADYDAALAVSPGNREAMREKGKAILAYAEQALANGEYDLALSIAQPEAARNREAADLVKAIADERKKALRRPRRFRLVNTMLGLIAFALILGGAYVYFKRADLTYDMYRSRNRSDSFYYRDIRKEVETLAGLVRAAEHNAGVWKNADLQANTREIQAVLMDCLAHFPPIETATPSGIKTACDYLYGHMDELMAQFDILRGLKAQLPKNRRGTLANASQGFTRLQKLLNEYRQAEGRR